MSLKKSLLVAIAALSLSSCLNSKIEGRWLIDRIQTGHDEKKPKARWIEFYEKGRQENGSGWQKHGVGTWDIKRKRVQIVNENGYLNEFDAYKVKIKKDQMEWSRKEDDGLTTKILLSQINETPMSHRDKLLGVWKLKTVLEDGSDRTLQYNPKSNRYMLIRWDNMFVVENAPGGRMTGLYRVEGGRYEIEVSYNTEDCLRETWAFQIWPDRLVLTSVNSDKEVVMEFMRTNELPEFEE